MLGFLSSFAKVLIVACMCLASSFAQDDKMPALKPLPKTRTLVPSSTTNFTFVFAGDNRPAKSTDPQPAIPGEIFAAVQKLQPAFVLWSGDTIYGKDPDRPKRIRNEYQEFLKIAKTGGVPVFNAPGNHELDDDNNVPNADMMTMYRKNMGLPYGAFDYGNSRFIALDSEEEPPFQPDAPKPKKSRYEAPGYLDAAQMSALKDDLDRNKDKAHIFIFMHHPVKPAKPEDGLNPDTVAALETLFQSYTNISYVLSGHEHMYYNPQSSDGMDNPPSRTDPTSPAVSPFYLISGGGGAPLKDLPGGFYHYLVFTVSGTSVNVNLVKIK